MGGGGGSKGTSTEVKEIKLPPWVDEAAQANYKRAQAIADRPYARYEGQTVAPLDAAFNQAYGMLGGLDDYYGNYKDASTGLRGVLAMNPTAIDPSKVSATMLPDMDRRKYMNPITDAVEGRAIANAQRTGQAAQTALASGATKSGGLGGSRQAIQQAVQGAETTRGIGDLSAELRSKAYDTASGLMGADIANKLKADTQTGEWRQGAQVETERNKLQSGQNKISAAAGLTSAADAAQAARMNTIAQYLGLGSMKQSQRQRVLDDARAKWQDRRDYPLETLNIVMAALGMSPYGHTETSTKTESQSGGGGGMGGMLGGAAMQMLPKLLGMFSDREAKTNIDKIGEIDGLPIYAYDYKSDVNRSKKGKIAMGPKRVGPMAQDVEKILPQAVRKVGGKRVIDLTALALEA
jgi:hypothetical protein